MARVAKKSTAKRRVKRKAAAKKPAAKKVVSLACCFTTMKTQPSKGIFEPFCALKKATTILS